MKKKVNSNVLFSKIGEEIILMSMEAESYFSLNSVGSRIWELLSIKSLTLDEIIHQLSNEYNISIEDCRKDVMEFLDEMSGKKLILTA